MSEAETREEKARRRHVPRWLILLLAVALLSACWMFLPLGDWLEAFAAWVRSLGAAGIVAFIAAYALTTLLVIPGVPMTIAAGVAYGWWGVPLVLVSAMLGSVLAFLASRYWFNEQIRAFAAHRPRLRSAMEAVNDESWTVLALMRLSPVLPFNVQNYLLGLTGLSFPSFVASTTAGMIPGAVLYVYLGVLGFDAGQDGGNTAKWILLILGLAATVFVTMLISKRAQAKLAARSEPAL